jgi:hypothetical protein
MEQWGRVRAGSCVRMRERRDEDEMRERSKYCVRRREVVKALHSLQVRWLEGLGGSCRRWLRTRHLG